MLFYPVYLVELVLERVWSFDLIFWIGFKANSKTGPNRLHHWADNRRFDSYARSPTTPIYTLHLAHEVSSFSSKCLYTNTHSYTYIAFSITTLFNILYFGLCLLRDKKYKNKIINFYLY